MGDMPENEPPGARATLLYPFRVGETISTTFKVFFDNVLPLSLAGLAAVAVQYLLALVFGVAFGFSILGLAEEAELGQMPGAAMIMGIVMSSFGGVIVGIVLAAVLVMGVLRALRREPMVLADSWREALPHLASTIGAALVVYLLMMVGSLLLLIPGLMVMTAFFVVIPAAVAEGLGVGAAMGRAADLTRHFRLRIFGLMVLFGILMALISAVVLFVVAPINSGIVINVVNAAVSGITYAISVVLVVVTYHNLRRAKAESLGPDFAKVFE